ncbi:GGDEF domain-containing protein [Treponema sp.]|uniref:GGDEF domain-containing protein n=1 Tax=Treponema sp. TaxID=166 RepID=UPI00388F6DCB
MDDSFFNKKKLPNDFLTGLYTRDVIVDYAKHLIKNGSEFSLCLIDIDNFKNVNDNYGHTTGDHVISFLANKLKESFGNRGVVGRFGGDEFMVVIPEITEYDAVWSLLREVHKSVDGIQTPDAQNFYLTCTFGLSRFPEDAGDYDSLFELTDKALYRGKIKGRNCFIIYLEAKHKNIQLHSADDTTISSMQMHTQVFRFLNSAPHIQDGIKDLLLFLGSNLMIDHLGLQTEKGLFFSQVYSLALTQEFKSIENPFFMENTSPSMGIYYMNDTSHLENINQMELLEECQNQGIRSVLYARISYNDEIFGYIRADSTSNARIWQYKDMDLLITAANAIAMSLHFQNKKIEEL